MKHIRAWLAVAAMAVSVGVGTADAAQLSQYYYTDKK